MNTRLLLLALLAIFALPITRANDEQPLPRFVGIVGLGDKIFLILADADNSRPGKWVLPGQKFGEYEILIYDNEKSAVVLGKGRSTYTVPMETAKVRKEKGEPLPPTRDQALQIFSAWFAATEEKNLKLPYYQPLDPQFEQRLSEKQRASLAKSREHVTKQGKHFFVVENEGAPMVISLDKVASELPWAKTALVNLTPADWRIIDERYARISVERAAALQRADYQKAMAKKMEKKP